MTDTLLRFGDEVKAIGENRFTGYLVRFSGPDKKDLAGDYFTKETQFGVESGAKTPIYFNHRMPLPTRDGKHVVIKAKIGEGTLTEDDEGWIIDAIIYNRQNYEKAISKAGRAKKLAWSSGTAAHLVDREEDGFIKNWPLGLDASMTPTPCEPLNDAIPAKSLASIKQTPIEDDDLAAPPMDGQSLLALKLNQHIDDLIDDGYTRERLIDLMAKEAGVEIHEVVDALEAKITPSKARLKAYSRALNISYDVLRTSARRDYSQTIKGMFEDALDRSPSRWEMECAYCEIVSKMLGAANAARIAGVDFDWQAKIKEATSEYAAMLLDHALAQGQAYLDSGSDEPFYLKAMIDLQNLSVSGGLDLDDHSQLAVSALREVAKRFRGSHEARIKSGRVLSEKNRQRISDGLKDIQSVVEDLKALLDESQPMASDTEKRAAQTAFLRFQTRIKPLGVTDGKETARTGN